MEPGLTIGRAVGLSSGVWQRRVVHALGSREFSQQ